MLELLLLLATCTLGNMNVPIKWCGEGKLICPADVSGVGYEQCLDKDLPCGEHCHSYHNQAKGFCKETNKCYPEGGSDHIECRNKENGCLTGEHFCESSGGSCQSNSEFCRDFCDAGDYDYDDECQYNCVMPSYKPCDGKCEENGCKDQCGYYDGSRNGTWYCAATDSCLPLTARCNGSCLNEKSYCLDSEKRFWCEDEGICKTTYEPCGGNCLKPCSTSAQHYFCPVTGSCLGLYPQCEGACPSGKLYCGETRKCQLPEQPCYGKCRQFKNRSNHWKGEQLQFCEATNTCTPYSQPCEGKCRPFEAFYSQTQAESNLTDIPTVFIKDLNLCYVAENPSGKFYEGTCKAIQKAEHHLLNCAKDEFVLRGNCTSLSQRLSSKEQCIKTRNRCVKKFGGIYHLYRWCNSKNACIPPSEPCDGTCMKKKPRMALCKDEGKCINIKTPCNGRCLVGRIKCDNEERCIHKSAVVDGVKPC